MTVRQPVLLFVCRHNAGRSQMAAGLARARYGDRADVRSAGIEPAEAINPVGVAALAERGIDIADQKPRKVTDADLADADVLITLVAGVELDVRPGARREQWTFPDPDAWALEHIRVLVNQIDERVATLL